MSRVEGRAWVPRGMRDLPVAAAEGPSRSDGRVGSLWFPRRARGVQARLRRHARRYAAGLITVLAIAAGWAVAALPACATDLHKPLFQIAEVPSEGPHHEPVGLPGRLSEQVGSMSVGSGHVWLAGKCPGICKGGLFRVDEFDATSGAFMSQLAFSSGTPSYEGLAVSIPSGSGEGQVYVVENMPAGKQGDVGVYDESDVKLKTWTGETTPEKSFGQEVQSVAVDSSKSLSDWAVGDVFVASFLGGSGAEDRAVIDVLRPGVGGEETYVTQLTGISPAERFQRVEGVTVDDVTGDLVVDDNGKLDLFEPTFSEQYAFVRTLTTPSAIGYSASRVDANDGEGDIYAVAEIEEDGTPQPGTQAIEFTAAGEFVGKVPVPTSEEGYRDVTSVAGDPETHGVFVGVQESAAGIYAFGPNLVVPDVMTGATSALNSTSVTLSGAVDPDGAGSATCQFEWGEDVSYGRVAACLEVPNGNGAVPVQVSLSGLEPDTTYHYRLTAGNTNGTNSGERWQDHEFTTPGPGLHGASAVDVDATATTFQARIDPHGSPSSYYFQYGATSEYGQQAPAAPGISLGSGHGEVVSSVYAQGLQPDTVYHYRIVVVSEVAPGDVEVIDGPDRTLTTQAASGSSSLSDGRQWELVSPADKLGARIEAPGFGVIQASADGNAIAYRTNAPTEAEPSGGYAATVTVLSTQGQRGWSSQDISEPNLRAAYQIESVGNEFQIFSEDLSLAAVQPTDSVFTPLSPQASESTSYLRTDYSSGDVEDHCRSSCYTPLVTGEAGFANVLPGAVFGEEPSDRCEQSTCGPRFQGASPDLDHVVLSSPTQLTSTPVPAGGAGLYEWSEGALQLIDVLPKGEEGPAVLAGTGVSAASNSRLGVRGSVSENGQRVIMEGGKEGDRGLYLRDVPAGETTRLDVPQDESGPSQNARYMGASSDASRIFFLDSGRLTTESSVDGADLYEYDLNAPVDSRLTDLSADHNTGQAADVIMMIGSSADGSYVYFAAGGSLAPGASEGACPLTVAEMDNEESERERQDLPVHEKCNLYVRHEGVTRLVAALPADDFFDWYTELGGSFANGVYARVSPNGQWLAFLSEAELAGYDTHDAVSGQPDIEVYLYDAASGGLACASCDPSGARPVGEHLAGNGSGLEGRWVAASVPQWTAPPRGYDSSVEHQPRYLSDSGRLFFDSSDALVPQDVNGAQDVYELEPAGIGDCSSSSATFVQRSGGCVTLISAGTSPVESTFLDASETGGDVFFRTQSRLAPQDYDTAFDVYDAHECTAAVPCFENVLQPSPCNTEASCKASPTPQPPLYGAPASATFSGTGNLASAPQSSTKPKKVGAKPKKSGAKPKKKAKRRTGRKRRSVKCRRRSASHRCEGKAAGSMRQRTQIVQERRGGGR